MKKNETSSLIQFSVANFGCFRDRVDFSMTTRKGAKNSFQLLNTDDHLLKSSIIYGPNASGKSTLLGALNFMGLKIRKSTQEEHDVKLKFEPFLMEEGFDKKPSFFEIIFSFKKKIYQYNFELSSDHEVITENLFDATTESEKKIFTRKKLKIEVVDSSFTTDQELKKRTKKRALFLSTVSQWDDVISENITDFFRNRLGMINGAELFKYSTFTAEKSEKKRVLEYLKEADFCIDDFEVVVKPLPEEIIDHFKKLNEELPSTFKDILFLHPKYNLEKKKIGHIKLSKEVQSDGTNSFFGIIGPIIDTLENGKILVVDELNTHLHPLLCKFIVNLFNSEKTNPSNAQLIFTTHDVTHLSDKTNHRDQFWFTERDQYGAAKLFALAEFKERDGSDFQTRYMSGRYGALPFIESNQ